MGNEEVIGVSYEYMNKRIDGIDRSATVWFSKKKLHARKGNIGYNSGVFFLYKKDPKGDGEPIIGLGDEILFDGEEQIYTLTYSPTLLEIGTKKLKEHNGEMTKVSRKGGKYKIEGPLNHQIIKGGDFFIIEAEDDSCFLQTLDEVEIGEQKYWANL